MGELFGIILVVGGVFAGWGGLAGAGLARNTPAIRFVWIWSGLIVLGGVLYAQLLGVDGYIPGLEAQLFLYLVAGPFLVVGGITGGWTMWRKTRRPPPRG